MKPKLKRYLIYAICLGLIADAAMVGGSISLFVMPVGTSYMYDDMHLGDWLAVVFTVITGSLPLSVYVLIEQLKAKKNIIISFIVLVINLLPYPLGIWIEQLAVNVRHLVQAA